MKGVGLSGGRAGMEAVRVEDGLSCGPGSGGLRAGGGGETELGAGRRDAGT